MKKKQIKMRDLLVEHSTLMGIVTGKAGSMIPRDWNGKPINTITEDDDNDEDENRKLLFGQTKEDKESELTPEMKKAFLEVVGNFGKYGESIYREGNLKDITETILRIGQVAEKIALSETDEWFDVATVQRDMKSLNDSVKLFEKTAKDSFILQQRLEALYEDIASKIGRYFNIQSTLPDETQAAIPTETSTIPLANENKKKIKKII